MLISDRIKEMRLKRGMTLKELGERIGKAEATVQRYESGNIRNLKSDTIAEIADILHCSPAYLMGWSDIKHSEMEVSRENNVHRYEVVGTVKAGPDGLAYEEVDGFEPFDGNYDPEDHFVLRVKGDSMTGDGIFNGDLVLVEETCETSYNGQIGVAIVNGEEGTIKHIYITGESITLQSSNPEVAPRIFVGSDMNRVRIVGVVVEMKRKFR
ncbi:helix-turn-helix domain-containing protein [Sporolactobacillus shoreae]|uniref:Helix-turn-helix domain-containing protein n=1 Tax=Sporolactobacillus shoreae TaxID=1465501 RepID=A0A4Z0GK01_9BACL|nr:S24 family peptidase [Sporolactobacillus shoreae]TGA95980.1 helix-turn-helix domain-containing protein [Sporolactobacillus shoreae]